ncbi:MAG TPA: hypothetical protein VL129_00560 [Pseudomonas sp.]|nr:hypothetical protein [Pseudomonas sp.]HTO17631.1 hypothetical protein [Pseudomonas sp.]
MYFTQNDDRPSLPPGGRHGKGRPVAAARRLLYHAGFAFRGLAWNF